MSAHSGNHAVVLGGSIAGLLAARVLADFYQHVTIVERDVLCDSATPRRGVPQSGQAHIPLARCTEILEELFPGILDELLHRGVPTWDDGDLSRLCIKYLGHQSIQHGTLPKTVANSLYFPSRPLLEHQVRRRLTAIPNVTVLDGHTVLGLTATEAGDRVTGVRVGAGRTEQELDAELVVDATGRGSRTPVFLDALGYRRPPEDELVIRLTYASQSLRFRPGALPEDLILIGPEPGRPTTFACTAQEDGTVMVLVSGMTGTQPPGTREELIAFAAPFAPPHALAAWAAAEPLGEVTRYRIPSSRWRRYDRMRRFPRGLLVVGDAMCSVNPIYGQGMTVAAMEALVLRDCLTRGDQDRPQRFFRAAAKKVRVAWQTAVGSDLALPEVEGPRPVSMRLTNAYLDWVMTAAETDRLVSGQLARLTGMIDPPSRLLRPAFVARVAQAHRRRRTRTADVGRAQHVPETVDAG